MRQQVGWLALAVFALAVAGLGIGLVAGLLPPDFFEQPSNVWLVVIVLGGSLGVFLLLNSSLSASPRPRPFIFDRGTVRRGRLQISAGAIDFNVTAHAAEMSDILAGGQAAGGQAPRLRQDGGDAIIVFPRRPLPLAGVTLSEVTLSPNVPWTVDVRSGLGQVELDLFELSIPSVEVRTGWGDVRLIAPAAGVTNASLVTWLGDARIEVPTGVAVRINARSQRFAQVKVDERRFPRSSNGAWASPDYATAQHRLTLNLNTTFGDISVA
jgi:hypothetical protein